MEPLEYRAYLEKCWEKFEQYKGCGTTFQLKDHLWTLFLYEKGIFKIPENLKPDTIYDGCHCGICHMTILPTGDVYACRRMESRIGNALTDSMADLFLGEKWISIGNMTALKSVPAVNFSASAEAALR